jgi:DNA-binding response OmpR family regulator
MSSLHHILVVEDTPISPTWSASTWSRPATQISRAADGKAAVKRFDEGDYDLVILDLMLPLMDGMEVCRHIRTLRALRARDHAHGQGRGSQQVAEPRDGRGRLHDQALLGGGAARAREGHRPAHRAGGQSHRGPRRRRAGHGLRRAEHRPGKRLALKDRQDLHLTQKEFEILRILALTPGRPTAAGTCAARGRRGFDGTDRTIDTHIKRLRAKLETDRNRPQYVLTVWGYGYKFTDKLC